MYTIVKGGVLCLIFCSMSTSVFALTPVEVKEEQYGIDLYLEASSLEYRPPAWFKPIDHTIAPEESDYRIYDVLPFPEDRNHDLYLVIPALGAITPIQQIPESSMDFERMKAGKEITLNPYLQNGIIEYVLSSEPGRRGKRVDFGHSNYFVSDTGRYKTIFANLMALDENDQVRYYVRQSDGTYELYKYLITASYPSSPSNVQTLQRDGDGADALIFGCYHGLDGRWMIEATYIGTPQGIPLGKDERFADIPLSVQRRIVAAIKKIAFLEDRMQAYQLIQFFKMLDTIKEVVQRSEEDQSYKLLVIEFLEEQIAMRYPEGM